LDGLKRKISQKKFQNTLLKRNLGRRKIKNDKMPLFLKNLAYADFTNHNYYVEQLARVIKIV